MFNLIRKLKRNKLYKKLRQLGGHIEKEEIHEVDPEKSKTFTAKVVQARFSIPVPKHTKDLKISPDSTTFEQAVFIAKSVQKVDETPFAEPPDIVMNAKTTKPSRINTYPEPSPEGWAYAYYPAGGNTGKRPNIEAIRTWVENTKVGNASSWSITEEFGEAFGFIGWGFTPEEKKKKIDEVTYKVARKIWYVGRKPNTMTDSEWQEETKDMRPPEGSFNYRGEEKWNNFPYDETYMYRSGYIQ